jgi:hypothetical protein
MLSSFWGLLAFLWEKVRDLGVVVLVFLFPGDDLVGLYVRTALFLFLFCIFRLVAWLRRNWIAYCVAHGVGSNWSSSCTGF